MARDENPPFERGHTYYDGETIDTNDLGGEHLEGKEWVFEDVIPTTGVARTGRPVRCRVVRNVSGINLLPKTMVIMDTTNAGQYGKQVDGYATTTSQEAFPVDEYLPAAGVPTNDLFYIVMDGPATVLTSSTTIAGNILAVGNWVAAVTFNQTTGNSTCGRIGAAVSTGATGPLFDAAVNRVGRAMSAVATSGLTNQDVLVDAGKW
jgi:hypothetical protein